MRNPMHIFRCLCRGMRWRSGSDDFRQEAHSRGIFFGVSGHDLELTQYSSGLHGKSKKPMKVGKYNCMDAMRARLSV